MYTNVNLAAPIGALALLATGFSAAHRRPHLWLFPSHEKVRLRKIALVSYSAARRWLYSLSLIYSFASSEKVLARGVEKHFCEIDCHLAYSVTDFRDTKVLGEGPTN